MLAVTLATVALTVYLYAAVPKGFFPEQDTGRLSGFIKTDQDTSFQSMSRTLDRAARVVADDPAIANVLAFSGGRGAFNQAQMFATLEPERRQTIGQVMGGLRGKTAAHPGGAGHLPAGAGHPHRRPHVQQPVPVPTSRPTT